MEVPIGAEKGADVGVWIEEATKIKLLIPVIAHAVAVFGDEAKASHWLTTSLPIFDSKSPAQLLETTSGIAMVEQVLTRIEHNIPS